MTAPEYLPGNKLLPQIKGRLGWTLPYQRLRELALDNRIRAVIIGKKVLFNIDELAEDLPRWRREEQELAAANRAASEEEKKKFDDYRKSNIESYHNYKSRQPSRTRK